MTARCDFGQLLTKSTDEATVEDIFYCFRLILGRDLNPEERKGHFGKAGEPLTEVVRSYIQSAEFERRDLLRAKDLSDIILVQRDGLALYVDPKDPEVGRNVVAGTYEPHVQAMFHRFVKPGMLVLDIGANIGVFTMLAARLVGPKGKVIAVEPNSANVKLIELSRRRNDFAHVDIHCLAAAADPGLLVLHPSGSNGTVEPLREAVDSLLRSSIVPAINLDALIPNEYHIDFIKIDVERYEFKALKGLEQSLRRCHPVIVSEFAPTAMEPGEGEAYLAFLTELGYELGVVWQDGSLDEHGMNIAEVMRAHAASGVDHIDILARSAHSRERRSFVTSHDQMALPGEHPGKSGTGKYSAAKSAPSARPYGAHMMGLLNRYILSRFNARFIRVTSLNRLLDQIAMLSAVPPSPPPDPTSTPAKPPESHDNAASCDTQLTGFVADE